MALLLMMIKTFIKQHTELKRQKNRSSRDVLNVRHKPCIIIYLLLSFFVWNFCAAGEVLSILLNIFGIGSNEQQERCTGINHIQIPYDFSTQDIIANITR